MARVELKPSALKTSGEHKLVGKNYQTPDLIAKVQGKSKYAEDYRADGMLFCKLLLAPVPHGILRSFDASEALAMPGVKAVISQDDLPPPADSITDNGTRIPANKKSDRGLAKEITYQGEPILAVVAESELIAAEAIEKIKLDIERLPFVVDPLVSLRPGGPNARLEGNVWKRPEPPPAPAGAAAATGGRGRGRGGAPPPPPEIHELKWTDADFAEYEQGKLPMGEMANKSDGWSYGDWEGAFKKAALVLDETFITPDTSHQCLETRTAMAYWQNGKVYMHTGTQSTAQTVPAVARWCGLVDDKGRPQTDKVVFISEYTGGGFGSKITGAITMSIPAMASKKLGGVPVMMRLSREEEHYIGRARPAVFGRVKAAFSKEGKLLGLDMYAIGDNGPYDANGDASTSGRIASLLYQPETMRFRSLTVLTNTPPRVSQSAPGGMQAIGIVEPMLTKAARKLGVDQVEIRKINAPTGKAKFGPGAGPRQVRGYITSSFLPEALEKGAEQFNWAERKAKSPMRSGTKVRGLGVSSSGYVGGSIGYDGLIVLKTDGTLCFQSGIGNHGTESVSDVHRVAAEMIGIPWEKCDICWGNSAKNLPYTCASGGSQTTHAMTRAAFAVANEARQRLKELAAKKFGGTADQYDVANERVARKGGGAGMSLADAAKYAIEVGGIYDGHDVNEDVNPFTKTSVAALAGQGFIASARDKAPHDGQTYSFAASFAEVEVDLETGKFTIVDFLAVADVGTVVHPRALGGQVLGRSTLGIGHAIGQKWVYDQHYGLPLAKRFYQNKPPTILDVPAENMHWAALDIPDPETPVGARGIGEPPVGGGCAAIISALIDAVGEEVIRRAPVSSDRILASLELGRPAGELLTAHV
jgi:xanthine dehydrogenase molybdenum-binding subunit